MTKAARAFLFSMALGAAATAANAEDEAPAAADDVLSAGNFVDEVMSQSTGPHVFDWRTATCEIETGIDYVNEFNNYDTNGWHLGAAMPFQAGGMVHFLVRRYFVHATEAGKMLQRTPFRQ